MASELSGSGRRKAGRHGARPSVPKAPGVQTQSTPLLDEEGPELVIDDGCKVAAHQPDVERDRIEPADAEWIDAELGPLRGERQG